VVRITASLVALDAERPGGEVIKRGLGCAEADVNAEESRRGKL
jgi:hypothetical protein